MSTFLAFLFKQTFQAFLPQAENKAAGPALCPPPPARLFFLAGGRDRHGDFGRRRKTAPSSDGRRTGGRRSVPEPPGASRCPPAAPRPPAARAPRFPSAQGGTSGKGDPPHRDPPTQHRVPAGLRGRPYLLLALTAGLEAAAGSGAGQGRAGQGNPGGGLRRAPGPAPAPFRLRPRQGARAGDGPALDKAEAVPPAPTARGEGGTEPSQGERMHEGRWQCGGSAVPSCPCSSPPCRPPASGLHAAARGTRQR